MQSEVITLHCLRLIGYANLAALTLVLWGLKGGWQSSVLVALPVITCILGVSVYFVFWDRLFGHVPRHQGRPFMRPYIIGFATLAAAVVLIVGLGLLASRNA
jgi:hypothetical protein